ncbi:type II toxin-antitoxin system RelE family toxin [Geminocystis sp. CENA526]|uniref:type II toxin-antitoxin system RelE family toxin n=1 Tax=Geminocystis sp. CENA526 TaxID=1355871 RepID=UPI003D6EA9B5
MVYQIRFSQKASKDINKLSPKQKEKLKIILEEILSINPYIGKPLKGNLKGLYSYRLNIKDRILYEIIPDDQTILIIRAKSHYGD